MNNNVNETVSLPKEGKRSSGAAAFLAAAGGKVYNWFRPKSLSQRKANTGWIFVLPFVIGIIMIYAPVIVNSVIYSFSNVNYSWSEQKDVVDFAGWEHYEEALLGNSDFVKTLIAGLKQLIIDVPAIVIFSLFVAVVLNQKMVGRAAFRAIFFIPVVLSTGLLDEASNLMVESMGSGGGIDDGSGSSASAEIINAVDVERLFATMKVGKEIVDYVVQLVNDIYNIVNRSGVQILIFLAALQSISPSIYEACTIDGATAWETFWKITFPMISPMILVNALYTIIDAFTSNSNVVMSYIENEVYRSEPELATAMSWIYFVIVILIIAAFFGVFSAYVFYQKRDS